MWLTCPPSRFKTTRRGWTSAGCPGGVHEGDEPLRLGCSPADCFTAKLGCQVKRHQPQECLLESDPGASWGQEEDCGLLADFDAERSTNLLVPSDAVG